MRWISPLMRSDTSADPSGRKVSPQGASRPVVRSTGSPRVATAPTGAVLAGADRDGAATSGAPEHPLSATAIVAATTVARDHERRPLIA
jgi:hypothetical protein